MTVQHTTEPTVLGPVAGAIALQPTDTVAPLTQINEVLRNWHNDTHDGAYPLCQDQPCRAVRRITVPHR